MRRALDMSAVDFYRGCAAGFDCDVIGRNVQPRRGDRPPASASNRPLEWPDMSKDLHTLHNDKISATVTADGAELCSLKNADGLELVWQAGPQWPRHAPLLFPIVGRLKNDELRLRGKVYPMTQHGFARDRRFEWVEREPASCKLVLTDDDATRSLYPFEFRLSVSYALKDSELEVGLEITNTCLLYTSDAA